MKSIEKFRESLSNVFVAVGQCAAAAAEFIGEFSAQLCQSEFALMLAAYKAAEREHGAWVHRAKYSKKRRIRKKYHDRIMREYRRAKDGK